MKDFLTLVFITGSSFVSLTANATPKTCSVFFLPPSCVRSESEEGKPIPEARFDLNKRKPNQGFAVTELKLAPLSSPEGYEPSSHRLEVFSSEKLLQVRVVKTRTGSDCGDFNTCDMPGESFRTSARAPFTDDMELKGRIRDYNGQCLSIACW